MTEDKPFDSLIGKTLTSIIGGVGSDVVTFHCNDGTVYRMLHVQDCCESVSLEDVIGDLQDLIGSPIVDAREEYSGEHPAGFDARYVESFTWTFYHLGTAKGSVVLRWLGESNGYYSETVDFIEVT